MGRKYNIHAKQSKAGKCFEKITNKGPKIHYFALKLYTGASKLYSWAFKFVGSGTWSPGTSLDQLVHSSDIPPEY